MLSHHPHRIQGVEYYRGRLIAYSLGNFVFSPGSDAGRDSMILYATMTSEGVRAVRAEPVWVRIPVTVPVTSNGLWVLDIDYPPLNHVSLYLVRNDMVVAQDKMGSRVPRDERRQPARAPTTQLTLSEGQYDLWLQVQTSGAMVLPIHLMKPAEWNSAALNEQMLQGLLNAGRRRGCAAAAGRCRRGRRRAVRW